MKRWLAYGLVVVLLLSACGSTEEPIARGMALREELMKTGCSFTAEITADYEDKRYTFSLDCTAEREGDVRFTVRSPETIQGISGVLSASAGKLTFDDQAVAFPMLAEGEISPVSAPWLLMHILRGGNIVSCADEDTYLRLTIDDSYAGELLRGDIWLNDRNIPQRAEFYSQGRRVLSMNIESFTIG